jgi:cob(I)alamin adenosyltransferase
MVVPKELKEIDRKDVLLLEQFIEKYEELVPDLGKFVMPGESALSGELHFARTVCRRAERRLVEYHEEILAIFGGVPEFILQYTNRLSDLLFLLSRSAEKLD